ncbi:antibiotic biosynthesis monooxygenase [Sporolactobacillus shoreicorticis]|uniref:Quinol monooxygenase n=1 Tax=Sporolactobacillus shoreicorticis TaxID=1923877 RepID=A0ABW5RZL4_9BACL|nr:putative quinol monooxygenase [Sporolactobacillus shoreicorticis]MCO7128034.1 antibiotic biosynthesis monooxygenase [Sporolactobacillus shoreicorticis]
MIIIHARFKVKPERRDDFLSAAKPLIAGSQAEQGNISYNLMENAQEANMFMMIEEWQDQKAVDFHNQTKHFVHFGSISSSFFEVPTEVSLFQAEKK